MSLLLNSAIFLTPSRSLDGLSLSTYAYVWPVDKMSERSPSSVGGKGESGFGVEAVEAVYERINRGVELCESRWSQRTIVVVSHADTLQIMQTGGSRGQGGKDPYYGDFSDYRFRNGELR